MLIYQGGVADGGGPAADHGDLRRYLALHAGAFLGHTRMYHGLMSHLDDKHKEKVHYLLNKYGIIT